MATGQPHPPDHRAPASCIRTLADLHAMAAEELRPWREQPELQWRDWQVQSARSQGAVRAAKARLAEQHDVPPGSAIDRLLRRFAAVLAEYSPPDEYERGGHEAEAADVAWWSAWLLLRRQLREVDTQDVTDCLHAALSGRLTASTRR